MNINPSSWPSRLLERRNSREGLVESAGPIRPLIHIPPKSTPITAQARSSAGAATDGACPITFKGILNCREPISVRRQTSDGSVYFDCAEKDHLMKYIDGKIKQGIERGELIDSVDSSQTITNMNINWENPRGDVYRATITAWNINKREPEVCTFIYRLSFMGQ
ncbi:MAG: hypothetical protein ACI9BD_001139 [Candidatus Marinamargulisbacteria bacterium]|jgi:hypothetical protein